MFGWAIFVSFLIRASVCIANNKNNNPTVELSLLFPSSDNIWVVAHNDDRDNDNHYNEPAWLESSKSLLHLREDIKNSYSPQSKLAISSYGDPSTDCFDIGSDLMTINGPPQSAGRVMDDLFANILNIKAISHTTAAATDTTTGEAAGDVVYGITAAVNKLSWSHDDDADNHDNHVSAHRVVMVFVGNDDDVFDDIRRTRPVPRRCASRHDNYDDDGDDIISSRLSLSSSSLESMSNIHVIVIVPLSRIDDWTRLFQQRRHDMRRRVTTTFSIVPATTNAVSPNQFIMNQLHENYVNNHDNYKVYAVPVPTPQDEAAPPPATTTATARRRAAAVASSASVSGSTPRSSSMTTTTTLPQKKPYLDIMAAPLFLGSAMAGVAVVGILAVTSVVSSLRPPASNKLEEDIDQIFVYTNEHDEELFV